MEVKSDIVLTTASQTPKANSTCTEENMRLRVATGIYTLHASTGTKVTKMTTVTNAVCVAYSVQGRTAARHANVCSSM